MQDCIGKHQGGSGDRRKRRKHEHKLYCDLFRKGKAGHIKQFRIK